MAKTAVACKCAERLPGLDEAPDFVIPNEINPYVVIEAKLAEDDGTARDKVTRVQHLGCLSLLGWASLVCPRLAPRRCG